MGAGYDKVKGRIKVKIGDATRNKALRREGKVDLAAGEVKGRTGHVVDKVRDSLHRR
jgi:uncharacterized protein YjbJ (UPF0337 family)